MHFVSAPQFSLRSNMRKSARMRALYRDARALPSMLETVAQNANISSVYVGFADGSYRMALRVPPQFKVFNAAPPAGTLFSTRWIDRRAGGTPQDRTRVEVNPQASLFGDDGKKPADPAAASIRVFNGLAQVVVRSRRGIPSSGTIRITADKLPPAEIRITTK